MRRTTVLAAMVLLALPAAAQAQDPPLVNWNPLFPGFPTNYKPSEEADCAHGGDECIERTLAEMYRRFDRLYPSCDHNALFALVYTRVTEGIRRAVDDGLYEEPKFLNHEDAVFARMYFQTFDNWERRDLANTPPAWREALDAGRERTASGMGNLLMSMNAHINRDMPFMLARLGLTMPDGRSRKPDHDRGNEVLVRLYDDVIEEIARRWDPRARNTNFLPGTQLDDVSLLGILQSWREQVWRHAEMLSQARTPAQKRAVSDYIENYALSQAHTLEDATELETPEADSARRDAHCAAYLRTHRERGAQARPVVRKRKLRSRRGRVRVRIACPRGLRWCDGRLALERRRKGRSPRRILSKAFPALGPGKRATLRLRLPRRTHRALRRRGWLRVNARVLTTTPWGLEVSRMRKARLVRVRRG